MLVSIFTSALALLGAVSASPVDVEKRATLQQVTNFGSNPSKTEMYIYVPQKASPTLSRTWDMTFRD